MPRHLLEHPEEVSIVRLSGGTDPEFDLGSGPFVTVIRTRDETTVVCASARIPSVLRQEGPFRLIEVAGPLSFGSVGVLVEILSPLAASGVGILAYSSFDTDWVLVPTGQLADAAAAWRQAGLILTTTSLTPGGSE